MSKDAAKSSKEKKHFWKDFRAELKKVIWPTPKQVVNNTVAVITIVVITAAIVFVLDLAFEALNTYGIDKVRSLVTNAEVTNNVVENTVDNTVEHDHNHEHEHDHDYTDVSNNEVEE